jgi:hypothetical protein
MQPGIGRKTGDVAGAWSDTVRWWWADWLRCLAGSNGQHNEGLTTQVPVQTIKRPW